MAKTTCDDIVERLPWWANRTLEGAEAESVEAHLAECAACRGELAATTGALALQTLHLPIETLLDRVEDETAANYRTVDGGILSRLAVEEHLGHCAACREELALLVESRAAIEEDAPPFAARVTAFAPRPAAALRRRVVDLRSLALAASLLLFVVAAGGWLLTGRVAERRADRVTELERRLAAAEEVGAPIAATGAVAAMPSAGTDSELARLQAEAAALSGRIAELEGEVARAAEPAAAGTLLAEAVGIGPTFSWRVEETVLRGAADPGSRVVTVPAGAEEVSLFVEGVGEDPLRLVIENASGSHLLEKDGLQPYEHPLLGRHLTLTLPVDILRQGPVTLRLFAGGEEIGSQVVRIGD